MSSPVDTATLARLWIESHIGLFVVLVVSAVLLIVVFIVLLVYCCCCRRKRRSKGKGGAAGISESSAHGDIVDASSAVTTTIRGTTVVEVQVEKEQQHQNQQAFEYKASVSGPEIVVTHEDSISLEDLRLQQSSQRELRAEFPNLPELPPGVEVSNQAELRLHNRTLPEVEADMTAAVSASIAASASASGSIGVSGAVEPAMLDSSMRLPRTEVVLQTEIQQQHQQPLRSSPQKGAAATAAVVIVPPEAVPIRHLGDGRPAHEHRHGSSIYQSDDNEITIVDSDFSDYEDTADDVERKRATKLNAQLNIGLSGDVEVEAEGGANFGWETLPNQPVTVEELPIRAVDRQGEEYIPAPSPSLEEQQMRRVENLAELDRTLDVFEVEADMNADGSGGFSAGFGIGGHLEVSASAEMVDEEAIEPLDRSQVPH